MPSEPTPEQKKIQALQEQLKLQTYVDEEIQLKIKSVIKEQVTNLFTQYIQKREKEEEQEEKKFEDQQLQQMQNFQRQMAANMQQMYTQMNPW